MEAAQGKQALVLDGPLDGFTAGEVHGLGDSGGEVDVPLLAGFAFDELDLSREAHMISSYLTRYHKKAPAATEKARNVVLSS